MADKLTTTLKVQSRGRVQPGEPLLERIGVEVGEYVEVTIRPVTDDDGEDE